MPIQKTITGIDQLQTITSISLTVRKVRTWKNDDGTDVTETSEDVITVKPEDVSLTTLEEFEGKI